MFLYLNMLSPSEKTLSSIIASLAVDYKAFETNSRTQNATASFGREFQKLFNETLITNLGQREAHLVGTRRLTCMRFTS
jgi:hypothetical protein